jgi:hypothetical protein
MIKKITFDTYPITLHVFIDETDEAILEYLMINQCDDYQDLIDHPLSDKLSSLMKKMPPKSIYALETLISSKS